MFEFVKKIFVLFTALIISATAATAGPNYPLVQVVCDAVKNEITVTNKILKGKEGATFEYSDREGKYNPWDLVTLEHSNNTSVITDTRKIIKTCKLNNNAYQVIIEPHLFSSSLNGRCGAAISSAATIIVENIEILERTPFETYCHGNSPIIRKIVLSDDTGDVRISKIPKYKFY